MARLTSTGRKPALTLLGLEALLTAYYEPSQPSVDALAERFEVTPATCRKYLKMALGKLPRGRAANLPREPRNIQALLNNVRTEDLLGPGRVELLLRRREAGESLTALAKAFGVSRDRVSKLVRSTAEPVDETADGHASEPTETLTDTPESEVAPEPETVEAEMETVEEEPDAAGTPESEGDDPSTEAVTEL